MYLQTKPGLLKAVTIVIGLISTILGCVAVLNSDLYTARDLFQVGCELLPECPNNWLTMERFFIGTSITFLILSAVSLVLGFVMDISDSSKKSIDAAYHVIGGILIITGAALLLTSAIKLDKTVVVELLGIRIEAPIVTREFQKFGVKVAAGSLGVINGLIYFATAGIIYSTQS